MRQLAIKEKASIVDAIEARENLGATKDCIQSRFGLSSANLIDARAVVRFGSIKIRLGVVVDRDVKSTEAAVIVLPARGVGR